MWIPQSGYREKLCNVSIAVTQASIKFTITIYPPGTTTGGTVLTGPNTANPSCAAPTTTSGTAADLLQGYNATVKLTYPCQLSFFGVNYAPGCTLTAQTSEAIQ
jgi:hypothetical protein